MMRSCRDNGPVDGTLFESKKKLEQVSDLSVIALRI